VFRPPFRLAAASLLVLIVVGACAGTTAGERPPSESPPASAERTPAPTVDPVPTRAPSPTVPVDQGNVDRRFPELAVEPGGPGYVVHVTDPTAKAWRLIIAAAGGASDDRLEIDVEVGDVAPGAEARLYVDGALLDVIDMTGMLGQVPGDSAAAGGCHPALQVCIDSGGISIDPETGDVRFVLERIEPGAFDIQGATADWPAERFILGPWRTTEVFSTF
jgi:hypothetical protein